MAVELAGLSYTTLKFSPSNSALLQPGQDGRRPAGVHVLRGGLAEDGDPAAGREGVVGVVVAVEGNTNLLEVVDALDPPGGLAGRLHRRQEQRDQHGDDRDDDQELDEGEGAAGLSGRGTGGSFPGPGRIGLAERRGRPARNARRPTYPDA